MPYTTSHGVRIHYEVVPARSSSGAGAPVILHHGTGGSGGAMRRYGYVDPLAEARPVILFDGRGHGLSGKPHEPEAYTSDKRCDDVIAVLDAAGVKRAHFLGYSLGGRIGLALVQHAPQRLLSAVIGGAHPYPTPMGAAFGDLTSADPAAFIAALEAAIGEPLEESVAAELLENDLVALTASCCASPPSLIRVGEEGAAAGASEGRPAPQLLFVGERDARCAGARRYAEETVGVQIQVVPGLNHVQTMMRTDLTLARIKRFLEEVERVG